MFAILQAPKKICVSHSFERATSGNIDGWCVVLKALPDWTFCIEAASRNGAIDIAYWLTRTENMPKIAVNCQATVKRLPVPSTDKPDVS